MKIMHIAVVGLMAFIFPVNINGIQDRGIFLSMNAAVVTFMPCLASATRNGPEVLGERDSGGGYSNRRQMAEEQHPPDVQRFAKDVVEEMKKSKEVPSFEELLNKALDIYFSQEEFTDENYDEDQIDATVNILSKALLDLTSKDATLKEAQDALVVSTGHDPCKGPTGCKDLPSPDIILRRVVKKIKSVIESVKNDENYPTLDEIFDKVETETSIDKGVFLGFLEDSPENAEVVEETYRDARKPYLISMATDLADKLEKFLFDESGIMTFEEAIEASNTDEGEAASILEFLPEGEMEKLESAFNAKSQMVQKKIQVAKEKKAGKTGRILEQNDELHYIPPKNKASLGDQVEKMRRKKYRRRLQTEPYIDKMNDFSARLRNHVNEVQSHIRNLVTACDEGNALDCATDELNSLETDLSKVTDEINNAITPAVETFTKVESGVDLIYTADLVAKAVSLAVQIASNIPYPPVAGIFKGISFAIKPIKQIISTIEGQLTSFQNRVGDKFLRAFEKIENFLGVFDPAKLTMLATATGTLSKVNKSQCARSLVEHSAGFDVVGSIENAAYVMLKWGKSLKDPLDQMLEGLDSKVFRDASSTLTVIVGKIQPMVDFFTPLKPLQELLEKKISLPLFELPFSYKDLGSSKCDSGYSKGSIERGVCWEDDSHTWQKDKFLGLQFPPWKMRRRCSSAGYSDDITGKMCNNRSHGRNTRGIHVDLGGCSKCHKKVGWVNVPYPCHCRGPRTWCDHGYSHYGVTCFQECNSGYVVPFGDFTKCFKRNCDHPFSTSFNHMWCTPQSRDQKWHNGRCDHFNAGEGKSISLSKLSGSCTEKCQSGDLDTGLLRLCVPPPRTVKISIKDIADMFTDLIKAIEELPVVSNILDALDKVLSPLFKVFKDILGDFVPDISDFPSLSVDILPISALDRIDIALPEIPDLPDNIMDIPGNLVKSTLESMPFYDEACGVDMSCYLEKIGIDDMISHMSETVNNLVGTIMGDTTLDSLYALSEGIKCSKWEDTIIPVGDILKEKTGIILKDQTVCNIVIPTCKTFDFGAIEDIAKGLNDIMKSMVCQIINQGSEEKRKLGIEETGFSIFDETKPSFIPLVGFEIVGEAMGGDGWKSWELGISVAINLQDFFGGKKLKDAKTRPEPEPKEPFRWEIDFKLEFHLDVGVLYEPLDCITPELEECKPSDKGYKRFCDKLNFAIQPSFQLNAMIGYYGGIKAMATDIRRTNMWLNKSYDGFYTFLTRHHLVKFESLDPEVNLSKLGVAMEYGLSCFVGKIDRQKECLDLAKTTEIAEKGRRDPAPYSELYDGWKQTCDTFYETFDKAYVAAEGWFLCTTGSTGILEKISGANNYRVKGVKTLSQKACDESKMENISKKSLKFKQGINRVGVSSKEVEEAKLCIREWYEFITDVKEILKDIKEKVDTIKQNLHTMCNKGNSGSDLCPQYKTPKLVRLQRFIDTLTLDTNMFFGGLYPTNGFQMGLGVVIYDYTKPDNLIGPKWFIQISTALDEGTFKYSSFTIGSIPITELLQAPRLIWETLKALTELSSPGQLYEAVRESPYHVYSSITFKVEWPLLPLNPLLHSRHIHQFCGDGFWNKELETDKNCKADYKGEVETSTNYGGRVESMQEIRLVEVSAKKLINIAKNKLTSQSSTYSNTSPSKNAVDGNTNPTWGGNSMSRTKGDDKAWWEVDLDDIFMIEVVKVYNREDCCSDRLDNFDIIIMDNSKEVWRYVQTGTAQKINEIIIPGHTMGNKVRVLLRGKNELTLAEVEVLVDSKLRTESMNVMSAGYAVGNYAKIEVRGQNVIYPGKRGLNVVVMNEAGSIISNQSFDTHGSTHYANTFVNLISDLEDGTWVSISVKDEASRHLTTDAKNAIKSLGSNKIDSLGSRHSWCIIGMKGAATGTVVEDYNPDGVASCITVKIPPSHNY